MILNIPDPEIVKMILSWSIIGGILLLNAPYRHVIRLAIASLLIGSIGWFIISFLTGEMALAFLFACVGCLAGGQVGRSITHHMTVCNPDE